MRSILVLLAFLLMTAPLAAAAPPPPPAPPTFMGDEGLPESPDELTNEEGWTQTDLLQAQEADPQTQADNNLFNPPEGEDDENTPAAPQISEEQIIANAMDVAYQLYHAEDYEACAKSTKVILDKYPKRKLYWVLYLHGLSMEHQQLYSEAIKDYKQVVKQAGRSTYGNAATFRMGLAYSKMNETLDAIYVLRDVIDTHPRSEYRLQAYVHLGNMYRREGEWKAVERIYKELIRLYPDTMWAYTGGLYLAEAYAHQGKFKKAIRIYKNLQREETTPLHFKAQAQLRIGDIYYSQEEWQKSLEAYRVALRDYEHVAGIPLYAEQKIELAEEGRRLHRQPYEKPSSRARVINRNPTDSSYQMRQIEEKVIP